VYGAECGSSGGLVTGFSAVTSTTGGAATQTVTSTGSPGSIPARDSLRMGPAGSTDPASAATAAACANVQDTIDGSNPSFTTHVS
jgi:hypothetical protein